MTDCPRLGKWINGCRFRGRFDRSHPMFRMKGDGVVDLSPEQIRELLREDSYVRDVCITCGKTIERQQP